MGPTGSVLINKVSWLSGSFFTVGNILYVATLTKCLGVLILSVLKVSLECIPLSTGIAYLLLYLQRLDEAQKEKDEVEEKLTEAQKEKDEVEEKLTESTKLVAPVNQIGESSQERIKINAMRQSKMESLAKVSAVPSDYCTREMLHTHTLHKYVHTIHDNRPTHIAHGIKFMYSKLLYLLYTFHRDYQ